MNRKKPPRCWHTETARWENSAECCIAVPTFEYTTFSEVLQMKVTDFLGQKNSIVKCNNFLLIFLYILSHHNKAVNIHSFVGSLL